MLSRFRQKNFGVPNPQRIVRVPAVSVPQIRAGPVPQFARNVPVAVPRPEAYYVDEQPQPYQQQYMGYAEDVYDDGSQYVYDESSSSYMAEPEAVHFTGPIMPPRNVQRMPYQQYDDPGARWYYAPHSRSRHSVSEEPYETRAKTKTTDDAPRDDKTPPDSASQRKDSVLEPAQADAGHSKLKEKTQTSPDTQHPDTKSSTSSSFESSSLASKQSAQSHADTPKESAQQAMAQTQDRTSDKPASQDKPAAQSPTEDKAAANYPPNYKPDDKTLKVTRATAASPKPDANKEQEPAPEKKNRLLPILSFTKPGAYEVTPQKNNSSHAESPVDAAAPSTEQAREDAKRVPSVPYSQMYKSSLTPDMYGKPLSKPPQQSVSPLDQIKNMICCCLVTKEEPPEHLSPNAPPPKPDKSPPAPEAPPPKEEKKPPESSEKAEKQEAEETKVNGKKPVEESKDTKPATETVIKVHVETEQTDDVKETSMESFEDIETSSNTSDSSVRSDDDDHSSSDMEPLDQEDEDESERGDDDSAPSFLW